MSGASIPYHLRTNKAVERQLFFDLLARLEHGLPQRYIDYTYYGFGGAYMEDFRLAQRHLGIKRMFSIEEKTDALARQKFNRPASCIRFKAQKSGDFIETYNDEKPAIFWLDYTEPDWRAQLAEASTLARELAPNSILKITLACQPTKLGRPPKNDDGTEGDIQDFRLERLKEIFGELVPNSAQPRDVETKRFPALMAGIVKACMGQVFGALSASECLPIALYTYDDGTPMLTVTMLVGLREVVRKAVAIARLGEWGFGSAKWESIITVNTPDLTLKERIFIGEQLPRLTAREIQKKLGYRVAESEAESLQVMENYIKHHHKLPFFLKVVA